MTKDGRVIVCEWFNTPLIDERGTATGAISFGLDITERKRAEEELRRSEDRFATVFRASPVCTSLSRLSDGNFLDINDAFLRLLGYDREEVIGRNSLMLNMWENPDDRARMFETLRERGRVDGFETTFRTKSGKIRNVIVISEVVDVAGETIYPGTYARYHALQERRSRKGKTASPAPAGEEDGGGGPAGGRRGARFQ